ncbi:hypothetical protein MTO96_019364 [Rhipicephalus appendiculatus]
MFVQALGLFMLVAAFAVQAKDPAGATPKPGYKYEEDTAHFKEQNVEELAEVDETWFVKKRNLLPTGFTCHSATKILKGDGDYTYLFNVRNGTGEQYITWNVTMTPAKTGKHEEPNAVRYYTTFHTSKLMTYDAQKGCAVLFTLAVVPTIGLRRTCMVVQKSSTVSGDIPESCNNVYRNHCSHDPPLEDKPWDATCK